MNIICPKDSILDRSIISRYLYVCSLNKGGDVTYLKFGLHKLQSHLAHILEVQCLNY